MNDLEICKRIAEIEGKEQIKIEELQGTKLVTVAFEGGQYIMIPRIKYDPLNDDGVCFQLMVKYKVLITWQDHKNRCTAVIDGRSDDIPYPSAIADVNYESANKAICLAIIEADDYARRYV